MRLKWLMLVCISLCSAIVAVAQLGIRGQIFLPNGEPLQRTIRFTLATDGGRSEILFTDSHGRIEFNQPVNVPYSITVESDGEKFDTTTVAFDPGYSGKYIVVHLRPFTPPASFPPGVVDVGATDQKVSPKAKQAYDSALKMLQAKQYEQAIEPLKRAISLQSDYFHAYNDLGVLYMKLKQFDQAADAFHHAIKINDKVYLPHLNLGIALNHQGKYKEAAELLTKLQHDYPELTKIHSPLIEALIEAHQWPQAEKELQKALSVEGADVVDLKIKLGMVRMRQDKFASAVTAFQEAIIIEPDNALAQFNLGAALLESGDLDEAEAALRRACQLEGDKMPGAQLLLGQIYFRKKDYPKAIEAFEAYLRGLPNAPNATQVKEAVQKLRRASRDPQTRKP